MYCTRTIRSWCSIIWRMATTMTRLLTITILSRGHNHILNIIVNRKIYSWFLHFHFIFWIDQRGLRLLLRNWGRSMMIRICGSINEISHFWSKVIMMITRCTMAMMNTSMRLTWILKMITTSRLSQISPVSFFWMSSIFSWSNSGSSLRSWCIGTWLVNSN